MADFDCRKVKLTDIYKCCSFINKCINEMRTGEIDEKEGRALTYMTQALMNGLEKAKHEVELDKLEEIATELEGLQRRY